MKKSKKQITAPRTYDPGKGRPKEYLAYLNYQEMQALKRLNGGNQERGPKGLPSFPPAGAMSGGSAKSPASTSTAKAAGSAPKSSTASKSTSSVSRISGGTVGGNAKAATGGAGGLKGSGTSSNKSPGSGLGGNPKSSSGGIGGMKAGPGATGGTKLGGAPKAGGGPADKAAQAKTAAQNNKQAQQSPGFKADVGRSAIGGISKDKSIGIADGSKIKGAIQAIQDQAKGRMTPTGYVQQNLRGPLGPNGEMRKGITPSTDAYRLGQVSQGLYDKFANRSIAEAARFMGDYARAIPGEGYINRTNDMNVQGQWMRDIANVGKNQALNVSTDKVLSGIDTYARAQFKKPGENSMGLVPVNSPEASRARDALSDAMTRPSTVSPVARRATNFTAPNTPLSAIHPDIKKIGSTPAGNFGVDPAYRKRTNAALKEADARLAGAPAKPNPAGDRQVAVNSAGAPRPKARPPSQNMQRPTGPYAIDRGAAPVALMSSPKPVTDRLINIKNPDGSTVTTSAEDLKNFAIRRGSTPEDAEALANAYRNAPQNTFKLTEGESLVQTQRGLVTRDEVERGRALYNNAVDQGRLNVLSGPRPSPSASAAVGAPPSRIRGATAAIASMAPPATIPSVPGMRGATAIAGGFPAGVQTPRPASLRSATQIASGLPAAAYTPRPSSIRNATQIAAGFPAGVESPVPSGFRSAAEFASSLPAGVQTPRPASLRGATAIAANLPVPKPPSYGNVPPPDSVGILPNKEQLGTYARLEQDFYDAQARIATQQEAGIKALQQKISDAITPSDETLGALNKNAPMIAAGTAALGMQKLFPQSAQEVRDTVNQLATNLYKQYGPEVNRMAWQKLSEGVGALTNMTKRGISIGMNLEGSIEGAKVVNAAEGYKLGEGKVMSPQTLLSEVPSSPAGITSMGSWSGGAMTPPKADAVSMAVDTSKEKISVGGALGTIDSVVDKQAGLSANERTALKQILAEAAAGGVVEWSSDDMRSKVSEAKERVASGETVTADEGVFAPDGYLGPDEALPKNVSEEAQKEMKRQAKVNDIGVKVMKRAGPAGYLVSGADGITKLLTGTGIAGGAEALKRQYMQSTPEGQAALEAKYPNLTKFAQTVGLTPQLPMSNYTNWADKMGLRGGDSGRDGGIYGIAGADGGYYGGLGGGGGGDEDGEGGGSSDGKSGSSSSSGGPRPDIYYQWDLGINIPSPGDPKYTDYVIYLTEREAAAKKMYDYV